MAPPPAPPVSPQNDTDSTDAAIDGEEDLPELEGAELAAFANSCWTLTEAPLVIDTKYFLVEASWFVRWHKWAKAEGGEPRPLALDNSKLFANNSVIKLKVPLAEGKSDTSDYVLVQKDQWRHLANHSHAVGAAKGGPEVARKCIGQGVNRKEAVVELYGFSLHIKILRADVMVGTAPVAGPTIVMSKNTTVADFKKEACALAGLDPAKFRVWDFWYLKRHDCLTNERQTLGYSKIQEGNDMLLEEEKDGKFRLKKTTTGYYSSYGQTPPVCQGVVGLKNLGNTCFMNSMLQCLSNCPALVEHFQSGRYVPEINTENCLGMQGEMAKEMAALFEQMWDGDASSNEVAPRDFKHVLGKFAPMFIGYQQQDAHEFMMFLLDALHEDLNRVLKKPYTETVESDGRPDEVVAKHFMETYKLRNQSIIVDLFTGQYKSTVYCPDAACGHVSITFDSVNDITLPLVSQEEENTQKFRVQVVYCTPTPEGASRQNDHRLSLPKQGKIGALRRAACEASGIAVDRGVLVEIYSHKVYCVKDDEGALDSTGATDKIVLYEVDSAAAWSLHKPGTKAAKAAKAAQAAQAAKAANPLGGGGLLAEISAGKKLLKSVKADADGAAAVAVAIDPLEAGTGMGSDADVDPELEAEAAVQAEEAAGAGAEAVPMAAAVASETEAAAAAAAAEVEGQEEAGEEAKEE
jgi:hypothetical protein